MLFDYLQSLDWKLVAKLVLFFACIAGIIYTQWKEDKK